MRGARVEVDLRAIADNVAVLAKRAGSNSALLAVVKANAYGHGAIEVAQAALEAGAQWLAVATLSEGEAVRHAGILAPMLVLGHVRPDEYASAAHHNISVAVSNAQAVADAERAAAEEGRTLNVQLKLDTGMGRIGARPEDAPEVARAIASAPHLRFEGMYTHLSSADSDPAYTERQIARYTGTMEQLQRAGLLPPWRHILNSAGILTVGHVPGTNMVRGGIAMYGLNPDGVSAPPPGLKPALSLHAAITFVKRVPQGTPIGYGQTYLTDRVQQIATLGLGYADGYSRSLSNRGRVLVGGQSWPLIGRVSMDQITVGIDPDFPVQIGDDAVLLGRQGDEEITAEEIARLLGTINYEVVTGLSPRLPRTYPVQN